MLARALCCTLTPLLALSLGACRTNRLPQYLPRVQRVYTVTLPPASPEVAFGDEGGGAGDAAALGDMVGMGLANKARARLRAAVAPDAMAEHIARVLVQGLRDRVGLQSVNSGDEPHDLRVELIVRGYGLRAGSTESTARLYAKARARLLFRPGGVLLWDEGASADRPLRQRLADDKEGAVASGPAVTFALAGDVDPEHLAVELHALAQSIGEQLLARLRVDAGR